MIEYACRDVVFHFNKKYLEDPTIPMWVVKFSGKTLYVNHVDCGVPWSTKESPDNSHTKGSIKVKNVLLQIDDENNATIAPLDVHTKVRLRNLKRGIGRILIYKSSVNAIKDWLKKSNIKHSPIRLIHDRCGTTFYVCDIFDETGMTLLSLAFDNINFKILQPNEVYYKIYSELAYEKNQHEEEFDQIYDSE
jgi:hypothetical protein